MWAGDFASDMVIKKELSEACFCLSEAIAATIEALDPLTQDLDGKTHPLTDVVSDLIISLNATRAQLMDFGTRTLDHLNEPLVAEKPHNKYDLN